MQIPIETRVVHKDLQTTSDEQREKKEIDIVGEAQPGRKPLRFPGGRGLSARRDGREPKDGPLEVSRRYG